MDKAFKLGCQGHVDNDQGEKDDLPSFSPTRAKLPCLSVEFQGHLWRKNSFCDLFRFFDCLAQRDSLGLTRNRGTSLTQKMVDRVNGALFGCCDKIANGHQLAALCPNVKGVEFVGNKTVGSLELGDHVVLFALVVKA